MKSSADPSWKAERRDDQAVKPANARDSVKPQGMTPNRDNGSLSPGVRGGKTTSDVDAEAVWRTALSDLALQLEPSTFNSWLRDARLVAHEDGEFIVGLPNAYVRDWVKNRLRNQIKRTLRSIVGRAVEVQFVVVQMPLADSRDSESGPLYAAADNANNANQADKEAAPPSERARPEVRTSSAKPTYSSQLKAQHTFATLIVGNHNQLAHAAARAVAEQPGRQFNPLFIYSGVGLGKTHLLHAIGNYAQEHGHQVLYCPSEEFTNELISSIRNRTTEEFRFKYRQVDMLLIDDIQFIGGKESTQEEFFYTFNHLHASGRQVVITSDKPPKALATLEERLRSRFEGGIQTDISQPDFETRVAILQSKAVKMGLSVSQEVLMLVAERVSNNVRELEGALNQIAINARLSGGGITPNLAAQMLDALAPSPKPCSPDRLLEIVAEHYHVTVADLVGPRRPKQIALARQVTMYLLRCELALTLLGIGERLGGRDHATVRHGVEKIAHELMTDETLRKQVEALRRRVYMPLYG